MFETLGAAAARGAREAWLQVVAANQAAVSLYSSLGFIEAYRYRYRVRR
jgi:ribosomal protein S18 acetylase RimI-like enzyme